MNEHRKMKLEEMALRVREHIVRMSGNGGCFIGASLSCADLIVYLYSEVLNIDSQNPKDPERDYLFLSKGHDVPALYGTLVEMGYLEKDRLKNHLHTNDSVYWHPNRNIPFVEFHSGSLGHLPSVAVGVAMDCKMRKQENKIYVITGDGELDEGSVWEAMLVANAYQLNNLVFIVDRNHFQANKATEELIPLEPLAAKFESFGARVKRINGHDFEQLAEAFRLLPYSETCLNVIIADTIRGKGLPSILARADRWFCNFSDAEVENLLKELHGEKITELTSETLTVR